MPDNPPLEWTAAAVYFSCGRASRVRRRGRSTALRYPFLGGPMRHLAFLLALLVIGSAVHASEEEFLGWSEVRIVGIEREDVGRVTFTAEVRDDAWRKVEAEAFGKKYSLDAK